MMLLYKSGFTISLDNPTSLQQLNELGVLVEAKAAQLVAIGAVC
jgi:hypothetical protein